MDLLIFASFDDDCLEIDFDEVDKCVAEHFSKELQKIKNDTCVIYTPFDWNKGILSIQIYESKRGRHEEI